MKYFFLIICLLIFGSIAIPISAAENPLSVPNNKIGIHILFDNELADAAKLINANGGDWGYVTIPIQAGDRDLDKWQKFMDDAKQLHVIPIIRLATEGDYFNTTAWRKPSDTDILDFANFLNSLNWPTKNRYIIVFNEVNRGDEWSGAANASEYAALLDYAVTVFKEKSQDFYIITSGMDNAAPNEGSTYIDEYSYLRQMNEAVPGIFSRIDGLSSHAYPNPGFSQLPSINTTKSIASFTYERKVTEALGQKSLPVFITETGWTAEGISDEQRAKYYQEAFSTIWNDPGIVAITPFLFKAGGAPFSKFSFLKEDGGQTEQYKALSSMQKTKGTPLLGIMTSSLRNAVNSVTDMQPSRNFLYENTEPKSDLSLSNAAQAAFKWIMKI